MAGRGQKQNTYRLQETMSSRSRRIIIDSDEDEGVVASISAPSRPQEPPERRLSRPPQPPSGFGDDDIEVQGVRKKEDSSYHSVATASSTTLSSDETIEFQEKKDEPKTDNKDKEESNLTKTSDESAFRLPRFMTYPSLSS